MLRSEVSSSCRTSFPEGTAGLGREKDVVAILRGQESTVEFFGTTAAIVLGVVEGTHPEGDRFLDDSLGFLVVLGVLHMGAAEGEGGDLLIGATELAGG
jgi:hypothetical protein